MAAVQNLCHQALWMDAGILKEGGNSTEVIRSYLKYGITDNELSDRYWPDYSEAPGNKSVKLHRVSVAPEFGRVGELITMETPINIIVEYMNLLADVHLHSVLHMVNDQGIIAFTTGAGIELDPFLHESPPKGFFRTVYHIPGNLLNSGYYRVNIFLIRGTFGTTYVLNDALKFEVVDNSERQFAWYGREPGVLCPQLQWTTEYLGDHLT